MNDHQPPISVVVPSRDRPRLLTACLVTLRAALTPRDELIVVDSASSDGRTEQVAHEYGATYIRCDEPGASRARNAGWRRARHAVVAFVDDDIRVAPGWARAVAAEAAESPDAAFITGRVGVPEGENPEYPLALKIEEVAAWLEPSTPNPIGHTANLAVRRGALERIGGFDELLGAGGRYRAAEDQDLFDRLFRAGLRGRYAPDASATHVPWRDRHDILALEWAYGIGTGARLAKLRKTERERVAKVMDENVWVFTRELRQWIRARYKYLIALSLIRLAGTAVGFARALPRPVHDGHLRPARRRRSKRQPSTADGRITEDAPSS